MIRLLASLLRNLRGPWIADDLNPEASDLDRWDWHG
jgi:hypothetical protein